MNESTANDAFYLTRTEANTYERTHPETAHPSHSMTPALVIAAHGSHKNPKSSLPAYEHAERIRDADVFDDVREAFWKEEPHFREGLRTVASDEVYLVPLFVSEGYFTETVIPREFRLEEWDPELWHSDGISATSATLTAADTGQTVHYCGPVGTHESMSDVIVQRAVSVTGKEQVGNGYGLAIAGHGTKRNANSAKAIEYHADRIRDLDRFDSVQALFMDEDPEIDDVTDFFEAPNIVIVPMFIADGFHTEEDIPEDVGLTDDHQTGYEIPTTVDGHDIWYSGAVGTEPLMAEVILERASDAGAPFDPEWAWDQIA